jgi:cytochrome P450 family 6
MITALLITIVAFLGVYIYIDFKRQFKFWRDRDVPFLEPSFPMGNIVEILRPGVHFGYLIQSIYNRMKVAGDYCGVFFSRNPVLLVLSPEFAKTILVRDFAYFTDRGVYSNESVDPLGANMFFLEGQRWRDVRNKVTPMFTSAKLKQMFPLLLSVGSKFVEKIEELTKSSDVVDMYDLFARYTTDCISNCSFGFDANSLENPDAEFVKMGRKVLHFSKLKALVIFAATGFREQARALGIRFVGQDVQDYFLKLVRDTIDHRKATGSTHKDFMQLLIDLMGDEESFHPDKLTFNEIAAQAFGAYFAGKVCVRALIVFHQLSLLTLIRL